jgi:hypothetical protein
MRRSDPITDLRRAIDGLPPATRRAMLDGVLANDIVMGAYTDSGGGICPMLAAHRNGGRTTFLAFARAWDRLGGITAGRRRTRRATQREVRILVTALEDSLMRDEPTDLHAAIAEHRAAQARRPAADHAEPSEIQAGRLTPPTGAIARLRRRSDAQGALDRLERERERELV